MKEIKQLLKEVLNREFIRAVLSNRKTKTGTAEEVIKIKVRPLEQKGELVFQLESFTKTQAFHKNLKPEEAEQMLADAMEEFRQMQIETVNEDCNVLISKKGKATVQRKKKKQQAKVAELSHNRKKKYILEEGIPVPFLQDLGVMTQDGKIVRTRFDKFRQINRFLEFIEDILPQLDQGREQTIIDFGCGKSYLTFAMYYYLHELKGYDIRIIGLDLKKEVIRHCAELAEKYGYDKLTFLEGDIADYEGVDHVDMVVTLHACDTATDYALAKAVGWGAKVILSVPCCQHELNGQIEQNLRRQKKERSSGETVSEDTMVAGQAAELLSPILDYGLLRERFAALLTDGLRAKYLEDQGYETQVLEFIDMEHTPKNILLRGVKRGKVTARSRAGSIAAEKERKQREIKECKEFLQVEPTLGKLMGGSEENGKLKNELKQGE